MTELGWFGPALATFVVILPAELPDKTFVATLVLATRFRGLAVWIGVTAAFAVQCLVAVTAGGLLALLPRSLVLGASGLLFAVGAVVMIRGGLRSRSEELSVEAHEETDTQEAIASHSPVSAQVAGSALVAGAAADSNDSMIRAILTSFLVLFAAEWGDLSQLLTAGLAARYHAPVAVFVGSFTALALVAALAVVAGRWLQERVPLARIRLLTGALLGLLALASLVEAVRLL